MAASAIAILMSSGCARYESGKEAPASSALQDSAATAAATDNANSTTLDRKFIRTSDMKFRVRDVARATGQIETLTRDMGGFVTYTRLESTTDEKNVKAVSADSALETLHYTVVNNMTLRVPNNRLDSTLSAIAGLVDYLDYRIIKADDVALQMKSNQKSQQRARSNGDRLQQAIDKKSAKLGEAIAAENSNMDKRREADEAELANLSLQDQVNYSTVSLSLYQRAETRHWIIPNEDNTDDYRPALGLQLLDALKSGWYLVEGLLVFLTRLWLLLLLAGLSYFIYRRYRLRKPAMTR